MKQASALVIGTVAAGLMSAEFAHAAKTPWMSTSQAASFAKKNETSLTNIACKASGKSTGNLAQDILIRFTTGKDSGKRVLWLADSPGGFKNSVSHHKARGLSLINQSSGKTKFGAFVCGLIR